MDVGEALSYLFLPALLSVVFILTVVILLRGRTQRYYNANTVGFLHAASGAGGGGERVLWVALDQLQRADISKKVARHYVVFTQAYDEAGSLIATPTDDDPSVDEGMLKLVERQFHIKLQRPVEFAYLRRGATRWLSGDMYPRLTLFLQTFVGGVALFIESSVMHIMTPIVFETVGVPMVYPLIRVLAGCSVVSYTHFPVVSSSMVERVRHGTVTTTNHGVVVSNPVLRMLKLAYYQVFTVFYKLLGQFPAYVFTNSSWTQAHVSSLFWPRKSHVLYAPCDVSEYAGKSKPPSERTHTIVSVGQFRPEKNHMLQLHAFVSAVKKGLPSSFRLVMIGGVRNAEDQKRVDAVQDEAKRLGVADRLEVIANAPFQTVVNSLTTCCAGLHSMQDEHFGIVVLEYLAAGTIPLAHNSGGVAMDIINSAELGFLAVTEEEFASAMVEIASILQHDPQRYERFQRNGAAHARGFDDDTFGKEMCRQLAWLLF